MPPETPKPHFRNRLLSGLDAHDFNLLRPHLKPVVLTLRQRLEIPNRPVEHVHFIEHGLVSVIATCRPGPREAEIGVVGSEGMTGLAVVSGAVQSPNNTVIQADGDSYAIEAALFRDLLDRSQSLLKRVMLYAFVFQVQTGQAALVNAEASIEERLSRWLLMAADRLETDEIRLTHEALSIMLGVRRPAVSIALQRLERRGYIATERGTTLILDRHALVDCAGGFYGIPEAEYARLLG